MKIQWILYNISLPSSILVTLIYWGALYAPNPFPITFGSVVVHVFNMLFMIVEQYVGGIPTRLLHIYYPVCYALSYVIFSIILYYANGTVLYKNVLDWSSPGLTVGVILGLCLFYFIAQFVFFAIHRALMKCITKSNVETEVWWHSIYTSPFFYLHMTWQTLIVILINIIFLHSVLSIDVMK